MALMAAIAVVGLGAQHLGAEHLALPLSRSGQELVGKPLDLKGLRWVDPPAGGIELAGKVTLVRWFTDKCPFCARSLPAIMRLQEEFSAGGFQTVAVYHPKPPRKVSDDDARRAGKALGYSGFLAVDSHWKTLRRVYLDDHSSGATSVSFLLDRKGIVRHVHPGPEFGPAGDEGGRTLVNEDYEDIRAAIKALLAES